MSDKLNKIEDDIRALNDIEINDNEVRDITKLINKAVNKRIKVICLKTIASVVIVVGIIFLLISPIMKAATINVKKISENIVAYEDVYDSSYSELTLLMKVRMDIFSPYIQSVYTTVEDDGFGNYDIRVETWHNKEDYGGRYVDIRIEQGKFKFINDENNDFGIMANQYNPYGNTNFKDNYSTRNSDYEFDHNKIIDTIKGFSDASIISATIGFKDLLLLEEVFDLFNEGNQMLQYVNVYHEIPYRNFGFKTGVYQINDAILNDEINNQYPNLILDSNIRRDNSNLSYHELIEEYTNHYISSINYLNDSEFNVTFEDWIDNVAIEVNDPNFIIKSEGIHIYASKKDMLKFYEDNIELINYCKINDVKMY